MSYVYPQLPILSDMRKIYAGTSTAVTGSKLASAARLIVLALLLCLTGYTGWAAPTTVCQSQTVTLTAGGSGGFWVSNNSSIAKVGPQTGIVTGVNPGTAIVLYRLPTGVILTNTVTVLPLRQTDGMAVLCQGITTVLTNKTPAGGTWSTNSNAISTVTNNGMLTGVGEGTAIVTFTSTMGCVATKTVTIHGIQPVTGFNSVCVGQTTTLANSIPGGRWSSSAGAKALVTQAGVVKGVSAGTVRISYITKQGCHSVSTVTVLPLNGTTTLAGAAHICQGNTIALNNSTPYGGTWTSTAPGVATVNSTTGDVTGVNGGSTTISFTTSSGGCVTLKEVTVTPTAPITGTMSVCVGQTTALSNTIPGGRWSTGADALAIMVTQSGILRGRRAVERSRVYYIWPSGCQAVATVTVRPLEPIKTIAATPNFCMNMTYQLTNATVGTGTWTSSNNTIASVSNTGKVVGLGAGAAIITYATDQACITTMSVNVIQVQPITGALNTCVGQTTTLANAAAGLGGAWSTGEGAIARVSQAGVVTGVSAGTTNVSFINPWGCHSTAPVRVYALSPITGQGASCRNGVFTLRNATPFGGTWSSSNVGVAAINPTTGVVTTNNALGTAIISFTSAASGCIATSTVRVVNCMRETGETDPLTEVAEEVANIQLYPNPNSGYFTLKGSLGSLATAGADEQATVEIMNMLGQVVSTSTVSVHNTNVDAPVQMGNNMPTGTYILNMHTANGSKQFRFILQH